MLPNWLNSAGRHIIHYLWYDRLELYGKSRPLPFGGSNPDWRGGYFWKILLDAPSQFSPLIYFRSARLIEMGSSGNSLLLPNKTATRPISMTIYEYQTSWGIVPFLCTCLCIQPNFITSGLLLPEYIPKLFCKTLFST